MIFARVLKYIFEVMKTPQYLVLFDGVCNLCNGSVKFLIKRDKKKKFRYASLQGNIGQKVLWESNLDPEKTDSIVFVAEGATFTKSTAVLRITKSLGGMWSILEVLLLIPAPIRNLVYDFIAKNRYKWYGKKEECMFPKPEWKELFVD